MATLDRQIPSPDSFLCEPWSSFVSVAPLRVVDNPDTDSSPTDGDHADGVQPIRRQAMIVHSHFPALEDFSLVVCNVCNKVVTPQGILSHYEKRHGSPLPSRSPLVAMKPKAHAQAPTVAPSPGDTLAFRVPKDYPHSRFNKAPLAVYPPKGARNKPCVSLPVVSLEKMPCLSRADSESHVRLSSNSPSSSSPSLKPSYFNATASQRSGEKLTNGRANSGPSTPRSITPPSSQDGRPSPARSPLDRRPSLSPSPSRMDKKPPPSTVFSHRPGSNMPPSLSSSTSSSSTSSLSSSSVEKKQQDATKSSSRSHRRLSGRVFDPNKHCGVQDPETKRPCTRSLTCKTHSLTHRRAVPGRRKNFDLLLAEHKGRAKEKEGVKEKDKEGVTGGRDGCSQSTSAQESPSKPHCPNGRPLSTLRLRLANAHIPRAPGGSITSTSTSSPLPPAQIPAVVPNSEPSPLSTVTAAGDGGRLSSDEGDAETPEDNDRPALQYSNHHPQPLGLCVFSSRLMGRGHYVFDRRWDKMRLVLQSMVEKHLNAQMWRKVPLAADSLTPLSSSSSITPQSTSSPSSVIPPSDSSPYTTTFPQSTSTMGLFSIRDAAHTPMSGKARNGAHKTSRPPKGKEEDTELGTKKRKNSSHISAPLSSHSSLYLTVDNHKKNGNSYHPTIAVSGGAAASPSMKKTLGREGLWHSGDDWPSRSEGSQGFSSQSSRRLSTTALPSTELPQPPASTAAPLSYGVGGMEGKKRRSPGSVRGKASKLSKPDGLESLFGKGNDIGGILASGSDSPRQAKLQH